MKRSHKNMRNTTFSYCAPRNDALRYVINQGSTTMKLLREKYKTWEGAHKRCGFENGVARSEYERGYKAKLYRYTLTQDDSGAYRVARTVAKEN
jgi:hypothetical protein